MKHSVNFTDYLNSCLKRQPSLKSTAQLKMGLTVNTFHTNTKQNIKHCRTKTDEFCQPQTMSTTSVFAQGKLKTYDQQKKQRKKTSSEIELKKVNSFKIFESTNHLKSNSTYKSNILTKQNRTQNQIVRSLQKLRKDILNKTNPQVAHQEFKNINSNDKKNVVAGSVAGQYCLLSNDLLQMLKKKQKKHTTQLNTQKQKYEKRQKKLINKLLQIEKKNQHCITLINYLRIRNIDIDSIWHEEKSINRNNNDLATK